MEGNKFYAIPLIGGILCQFAILGNLPFIFSFLLTGDPYFSFGSFFIIVLFVSFAPIITDLVLGIIMIHSAVKMKNRRSNFLAEKKKLLILSWITVGSSLCLSIFSIFGFGVFLFFYEPGLVGGLIVILGIFFYKLVTERNFIYGPPLIQDEKKIEQSAMKTQFHLTAPKFCTNCGFDLEGAALNYCPECGHKLV